MRFWPVHPWGVCQPSTPDRNDSIGEKKENEMINVEVKCMGCFKFMAPDKKTMTSTAMIGKICGFMEDHKECEEGKQQDATKKPTVDAPATKQ